MTPELGLSIGTIFAYESGWGVVLLNGWALLIVPSVFEGQYELIEGEVPTGAKQIRVQELPYVPYLIIKGVLIGMGSMLRSDIEMNQKALKTTGEIKQRIETAWTTMVVGRKMSEEE